MSLKLLADLHISPKTVNALTKSGYTISRVTEHLPPTATDRQIVDLAERLRAVILTQDLDFSALVAKSANHLPVFYRYGWEMFLINALLSYC